MTMRCRRRSTVIVACSFLGQALGHGLSLSMGVFYAEWRRDFDEQSALISWLATSVLAVLLGSSPIAGAMTRHCGTPIVLFIGGVLSSTGFICASFARHTAVLFVTIPLMTGFGSSLAYTGCVVPLAMNFKKHYTLMNGIASLGSGVGMVLWPVIFQAIINHYTWRGALLLMGGIQLHLLPLALILRVWTSPGTGKRIICSGNARKGPREEVVGEINTISCSDLANIRANDSEVMNMASGTGTDMAKESTTTAVPRANYAEGNDCAINTISGKLPYGTESDRRPIEVAVINSPKFDLYVEESEINYGVSTSAIGQDDGVCDEEPPLTWGRPIPNTRSTAEMIGIDSEQPSHKDSSCSARARGFFKTMSKSTGLSLLWENKVFASFLPVFIFGGGPLGTFLAHAAPAAMANGTPSIQAAFLLSVVGIASVITRATHGLLLKTGLIHQVLLFASAYAITGLSVYVFPVTPHYAVMVVCAIGVGVGSGIFIPLQLVLVRHIVPVQRFPGAIGMMLLCVCIGVMTSSLVSGYLLDQTSSYPLAFTFAGSMAVAAGLTIVAEHIVWGCCLQDERWPPKGDHRLEKKDR